MTGFDYTAKVLAEIAAERALQDSRFGEQNHKDGTSPVFGATAESYKSLYTVETEAFGAPTWATVLLEETYEAVTETDPVLLREELIQVAAVATVWIEALDRREGS